MTDSSGWTLRYSRRAERDVARLDPPVRRRVLTALGQLAEDPQSATGLRSCRADPSLASGSETGEWSLTSSLEAERSTFTECCREVASTIASM